MQLAMVNKSAFSKTNLTQYVGLGATLLTTFGGFDIDAETQLHIVEGILAVQAVLTVIFRTFFTAKPVESFPVIAAADTNGVPIKT